MASPVISKIVAAAAVLGVVFMGVEVAGAQGVTSLAAASSGGARASSLGMGAEMPRVFAPTQPRVTYTRYPWKKNIVTTIFWIGERPTPKNPTPNHKSSWDVKWAINYGGYDTPDKTGRDWDFTPKGFTPGQNPFYIALPYNDVLSWRVTKPEAKKVIPWFHQKFKAPGRSVCKGQWLAIRYGTKVCYAQWEDCGPFETTDAEYVFGDARPRTTKNNGAGLDVSPAVRDYLGMKSGHRVDWRFVDLKEVPPGPWTRYGSNNHFVQAKEQQKLSQQARIVKLREARDAWLQARSLE